MKSDCAILEGNQIALGGWTMGLKFLSGQSNRDPEKAHAPLSKYIVSFAMVDSLSIEQRLGFPYLFYVGKLVLLISKPNAHLFVVKEGLLRTLK